MWGHRIEKLYAEVKYKGELHFNIIQNTGLAG